MSTESPREIETTPEPVPPTGDGTPTADGAPAVAATPVASPFSVLRVLATSLRVMRRNLVPFLVLACVLGAPSFLLQRGSNGSEGDTLLALLLQLITTSLTTAVVSYGVIMELNGSRPSMRTCITRGLSSIWRVIGLSLFSGVAILAAMMLLVVPGVIVALMWFVIIPVTVIEKAGLDGAMKRSRQLTSGRKGDLFLILMVVGAINVTVTLVAGELDPRVALLWLTIGSALSTTFFAVTSSVAYVVLRQIREGTQVPEIATAFARIRK